MAMNQQSTFLLKMRELISSSGVPFSFSENAVREIADIESEFKWPFIGKRLDLRGKTTFTLGSKEVAFSVERDGKDENDFILGIHSADVANLFPISSAIDEGAFLKGKSVNLPEKTSTMLPEPVMSGFCTLREGEECFTVSVFMKINSAGKVKSVSFAESVIKVTANCESKEVEALLFNIDVSTVGFLRYKYYSVGKQLDDMFVAGAALKMARQKKGAPEIDTAIRTFSKKGIRGDVASVGFEKLSDPDRLVREIITAAGVEVAKLLNKNSIPCPYRYRESMSAEGNRKLREFLLSLGISTEKIADKKLVAFAVDSAHGNRNEELILAKIKEYLPASKCSLKPGYHVGVGAEYYVRFAYPASRYGDLSVQRIIKAVAVCGGDFSKIDFDYAKNCALRAVKSVMENEPAVKKLENRISDLYTLEYLYNNKNKGYMGTVWNVSQDGFEVEICLDNGCKGFLKNPKSDSSNENLTYAVGSRVFVKEIEVDFEKEKAFFTIADI